jgi:hypothetical protein
MEAKMMRNIFFFLVIGFSICADVTAQNEAYICKYLFSSSNEITQLSTDAISLAVDAVWEASGITGVQTTTGTLTQDPSNPDHWTYSASPNDKLIVNFANGLSVEFIFYHIEGYTGGTEEDFKWSHLMDFNTFIQNYINIRIYSDTHPDPDGKIYWQRSITGTALFDSQNMTLTINHSGNIEYDIGNGYAFYTYNEQATGTSGTGSLTINVNEGYWRFIGNDSNTSTFVMNTEITNNSSGNFSGTTYQYQNARVFWAAASVIYGGYYDKVVDASQWVAEGIMLKNNQQYGNVQFSGPVINGTYGPDLILHLNTGNNILLHTLIEDPTGVIPEDAEGVYNFTLMQNFPNPFNPVTNIQYTISSPPDGKAGRQFVSLKIYDALGNAVAILVNEEMTAGSYEVNFNAGNLASGIYFYTLTTGNRSITKKMILLR